MARMRTSFCLMRTNNGSRINAFCNRCPSTSFPVAANDEATLLQRIGDLQTLVSESLDLETAVAQNFTTYQTHQSEEYTISLVGHNQEELLREIKIALASLSKTFASGQEWKTPGGSYFTPNPLGKDGKVAFVYPGAFSAYPTLGRDYFQLFPELHAGFADVVPNPSELIGDKALYPRTMHRLSDKEMQRYTFKLMNDAVTMLQAGATYSTMVTKVLREQFNVQSRGRPRLQSRRNDDDVWPRCLGSARQQR